MSIDTSTWERFCETDPAQSESVAERICEAIYGYYQEFKVDGITVRDVHQKNATNHVISGCVEIILGDSESVEVDFIVASGDWAGFEVLGWGDDAGIYEPPAPTVYRCIPLDLMAWPTYEQQRRAGAYKELESGYNYDSHFAPGEKTNRHYRDWAARLQCKIGTQEDLVDGRKRALAFLREKSPRHAALADVWEKEWSS